MPSSEDAAKPAGTPAGASIAGPFEILALPARIDLDPAAIERAWRRAAAACHPDRFEDPLAGAEAARKAAAVNAARQTLRDPLSRAEALLARRGVSLEGSETPMPADVLAEMLELRESLAAGAGDAAGCERLAADAEEGIAARLTAVASLLDGEIDPAKAATIRDHLGVCRYLRRFAEEARAAAAG